MKTEIETINEHFGVRYYVRTPFVNKRGQSFMLRCHGCGFKTKKEARAYAKRVSSTNTQITDREAP